MTENYTHRNHYVLVHGACRGAWCWYKLKPRLESAGNKVTVLDLAASGINTKKIEDVDTFSEYSEPLLQLLDAIPPNEKVVLVGQSLGGMNIALAMDKFPEKVAVGVFLTALTPDIEHKPSYVYEKVGTKYLSYKLYQGSSTEDIELAKTLLRPASTFTEDLSQQKNLSKQGYGSVPHAFVVCTEDLAIPLNFQQWMIQNAGINDVVEIKGADHMAMISKPQEVCDSLLQIASRYP